MIYVKRKNIEKRILELINSKYIDNKNYFQTEDDFNEFITNSILTMIGREKEYIPKGKIDSISLTEKECRFYVDVESNVLNSIVDRYNGIVKFISYGNLDIVSELESLRGLVFLLNKNIGTNYTLDNIHQLLSHGNCGGLVLDYENIKKVEGDNGW